MIKRPPVIEEGDIVSVEHRPTGATVYIMSTSYKTKTPEELQRQEKRLLEVSWQVITHMRNLGIDV